MKVTEQLALAEEVAAMVGRPAEDVAAWMDTLPASARREGAKRLAGRLVADDQEGHYLMWVGYSHYPTIETFLAEAETRGVSKRIGRIPREFVLGKSRVFLAHDEGIRGEGVIFGWFTPRKVEVIVYDEHTKLPSMVIDRLSGVTPTAVPFSQAMGEEERGCGNRGEVYAVYMASTAEKPEEVEAGEATCRGGIWVLNTPRRCPWARFRAMRRVGIDEILSLPEVEIPTKAIAPTVAEAFSAPAKSSWSPEELSALRDLVAASPTKSAAFREFVRSSQRSVSAVEYQYRQMQAKEAK